MSDNRQMTLGDTAEMMQSDNYKERFRAEYHQLRIRYEKLQYMLVRWDNGSLDFTPTCVRPMYDRQIQAMKDYLEILRERAKIEGVEL